MYKEKCYVLVSIKCNSVQLFHVKIVSWKKTKEVGDSNLTFYVDGVFKVYSFIVVNYEINV